MLPASLVMESRRPTSEASLLFTSDSVLKPCAILCSGWDCLSGRRGFSDRPDAGVLRHFNEAGKPNSAYCFFHEQNVPWPIRV